MSTKSIKVEIFKMSTKGNRWTKVQMDAKKISPFAEYYHSNNPYFCASKCADVLMCRCVDVLKASTHQHVSALAHQHVLT